LPNRRAPTDIEGFQIFLSVAISLLVFSAGCTKAWEAPESVVTKVEKTSEDFAVAESVAKDIPPEIYDDYLSDDATKIRPTAVELEVWLIEKTVGVLGGVNHHILFERGGGELDLADFVKGRGNFYFKAVLSDAELMSQASVYYFSDADQVKMGEETFGSGCQAVLDMTSHFRSFLKGNGILTSTADSRYSYLLSGQYLFWVKIEKNIYFSALKVVDSKSRIRTCK